MALIKWFGPIREIDLSLWPVLMEDCEALRECQANFIGVRYGSFRYLKEFVSLSG